MVIDSSFVIGVSSSLEPLDTIDIDYYDNEAIKASDVVSGWSEAEGTLSKLILHCFARTPEGIMTIDFCNEHDQVQFSWYAGSRNEMLPIFDETYIGIQSYTLGYAT